MLQSQSAEKRGNGRCVPVKAFLCRDLPWDRENERGRKVDFFFDEKGSRIDLPKGLLVVLILGKTNARCLKNRQSARGKVYIKREDI